MLKNDGYYTPEELREMGIKQFGENVKISRKASLYMTDKMTFGHDVRIDDFCLLVGEIHIGNYVHVCTGTGLHASSGSIVLEDFVGISSHVAIYAAGDDYSGEYMTNPMVSDEFKKIVSTDIVIGRHVIIGTGAKFLPGSVVAEGDSIGALTLVRGKLEPWKIYAGIPCRAVGDRKKDLLKLEQEFLKSVEAKK